MINKDNKLLTVKQVSDYFSLTERSIQRLSKQGKIKGIKLGKQWKFYKKDIEEYLKYGTDFSKEPARRSVSFVELRAHPRINCSLRCQYSVNMPPFKDLLSCGIIKNISAGGVFLVSQDNIETGDPVDLEFALGDGDIRFNGRVVRKDDIGLGIKFRNISGEDRDRIIKYVG